MKDLIIIGGGFWGTALYIKGKENGMSCMVLDKGYAMSGSRNAGALTCKRWYKSDTITKHLPSDWTYDKIDEWIDWLVAKEHIRQVGQWTYNKSLNTWRRNDDAYITNDLNSILALAKPKYCSVIRLCEVGDYVEVITDQERYKSRYVAVAAGLWTDELLKRSGFKTIGSAGLMGRAMLLRPDNRALRKRCSDWKGEVASVIVRPYKNFDLLPTNNRYWYWGVTTEKYESEKAWNELAEAATYLLGGEIAVLKALRGLRAVCTDGTARVALVSPKKHVLGLCGGSKVGLGLAGVAADNAVRLML